MKLFLLLTLFAASAIARVEANQFPLIFNFCEGEGCGCTKADSTREAVPYYKGLGDSKPVGTLKKRSKAQVLESYTRVNSPGEIAITRVSNPKLGVKAGDRLQYILNIGEGHALVWNNFQPLNGKGPEEGTKINHELSWNLITAPDNEEWHKLKSGDKILYVKKFPFENCLE